MKKPKKAKEISRARPLSFLETCLKEYRELMGGNVIGYLENEGWNWDVVHSRSGIYGLMRVHNDEILVMYGLDRSGGKWRMKAEYHRDPKTAESPRVVP